MKGAIWKGSLVTLVIVVGCICGLVVSGKNVSNPDIVFESNQTKK